MSNQVRKFPQISLAMFASVKLTVALIITIAITVLVGAWCPQEGAVGPEKVFEQFGDDWGRRMIEWGVSDIFHSPFFLGLIGLLTVNMVVGSFQRVFPKLKVYKLPPPFLASQAITKMPVSQTVPVEKSVSEVIEHLHRKLKKRGYSVRVSGEKLTAEKGKIGRLAPTVTHIGLLTLLAGVTITSWTGFTGFLPVALDGEMKFDKSDHSKMWLGTLPKWTVHIDATRREDYDNGSPKQWYSTLTVFDTKGKAVKTQEISVNNPLSYDNVDIYQSSWGLDHIIIAFNGHELKANLRQMGKTNAAFLPLDDKTTLVLSVRDQVQPLRVFAKVPEWREPRILAVVNPGQTVRLGDVDFTYKKVVPVTGLQYKSDPGLPVTYIAFIFITAGVMLAAIPFRQVWACAQTADQLKDGESIVELTIGGTCKKAKRGFENEMRTISLEYGTPNQPPDAGISPPVVEAIPEQEPQLAAK